MFSHYYCYFCWYFSRLFSNIVTKRSWCDVASRYHL